MRSLATIVFTTLLTTAVLLIIAGMPAGGPLRVAFDQAAITLGWKAAPLDPMALARNDESAQSPEMSAAEVHRRLALLSKIADSDFTPAQIESARRAIGSASVETVGERTVDASVLEFALMLRRSAGQRTDPGGDAPGLNTVSGATSQGGNGDVVRSGFSRADGLMAFALAWVAFTLAVLAPMARRR